MLFGCFLGLLIWLKFFVVDVWDILLLLFVGFMLVGWLSCCVVVEWRREEEKKRRGEGEWVNSGWKGCSKGVKDNRLGRG